MAENTFKKKSVPLVLKNSIMLKSVLLQGGLSIFSIILGSVIAYAGSIKQESFFYIVVSLLALSSFAAAYYSGKKVGKNGLVIGLLFCLPLNLAFCLISLVLNSFKADATVAISIFIMVVASMLGGILSVNSAPKKASKRKVGRK